jgi:autotransporter-associated beta strand protein
LASAGTAPRAIANDVYINGNATIGDNANSGAVRFLGNSNELAAGNQTITTNVDTVFENGLSGAGGLIKDGNATLTLRGDSTYAGGTWIKSGKLVVNGSLSSPRIYIDAGATLGGAINFNGTVEGPGTFAPGNSARVTQVNQVNPTGGTDFIFDFTQIGAPNWTAEPDANSGNDVTRITNTAQPFFANLTGANDIEIRFSNSVRANFTATAWTTLQGGFFTDRNSTDSLASAIAGATVIYRFETSTPGVYVSEQQAREDGLLPASGQGFVLRTRRVDTATFFNPPENQTITNGFTMEIVSVPEPSTIAMGGMALMAAMARHRRVRGYLARLRIAIARR